MYGFDGKTLSSERSIQASPGSVSEFGASFEEGGVFFFRTNVALAESFQMGIRLNLNAAAQVSLN